MNNFIETNYTTMENFSKIAFLMTAIRLFEKDILHEPTLCHKETIEMCAFDDLMFLAARFGRKSAV